MPLPTASASPTASITGVAVTPDNEHQGRRAYRTLDAWRGLASVWVVLYHASLSLPALHVASSHSPGALLLQGGYLGVPLFFVISGYCIASAAVSAVPRAGGAKSFFTARVRRIYPPYLVVLLLSLAVLALMHSTAAGGLHSPLLWLSSLTLAQIPLHQPLAQSVFWTLNYEAAFYVLVGAPLLLPARLRTPRVLLNILHTLTLLATALLVLLPCAPWFPLDFWTQFGLGVLVFDCLRHPQARFARLALILTVLGALAFAVTHSYGNVLVASSPPVRIALAVSAGFALLLLALYKADARLENYAPVRLLGWLGGFSYSLYLVHPLAIGAVLRASQALPALGRQPALCFLVEISMSLVCARALFVCCERPFLRLGKPRLPQSAGAATVERALP